jgi:hypothetical protein
VRAKENTYRTKRRLHAAHQVNGSWERSICDYFIAVCPFVDEVSVGRPVTCYCFDSNHRLAMAGEKATADESTGTDDEAKDCISYNLGGMLESGGVLKEND